MSPYVQQQLAGRFGPPRGRAGFTLPEVLIASTILAAVVGALVVPFSLAHKHQQRDARQTTAAALAEQMIERMVNLSYNEVLAMDGRVETGSDITDAQGQPIGDASLDDYELSIDAGEVTIPLAGEDVEDAATFCVATVVVTHEGIRPVTFSRMFAPDE